MDADLFLLVLQRLIERHGSRRINQAVLDRIIALGGEMEKTYLECELCNCDNPVPVAEDRQNSNNGDNDELHDDRRI